MKLKSTEVAGFRKKLLEKQGNRCAICQCSFDDAYFHKAKRKKYPKHNACLDHDHKTGQIRGVLCSGCNSMEGKLINAIERWHTNIKVTDKAAIAEMLFHLANYYDFHRLDQHMLTHHTFRTDEEKRLLKNKRAVLKRKNTK